MFKRIIKNIAALAAGQGIHFLLQFLLPPAFIAAYGVNGYGEWLVLAAAIGFLSTLDFGLQTYILNELTMLYHRGELEKFHQVQSTALRLVLGVVLGVSVLAITVFFIPASEMLNLRLERADIVLTLYFLALQILFGIAFGYITGTFRTFGKAHRGAMWGNAQRGLLLLSTLLLVAAKSSYWQIAAAQLATVVIVGLISLADLRRAAPEVFPRLTYWNGKLARSFLKPSLLFGFFLVNNFLLFQVPVLLLNHFFGPVIVVVFSVARTLFSFVRQTITLTQSSIAPEITRLHGIQEKEKLARLYTISESMVLSAALVFNFGLYMVSPILVFVWLKRVDLFLPDTYLLMMIVSILMSVKEYKLYFQFATNTHGATALSTFSFYSIMTILSVPLIQLLHINGFLIVWMLSELGQIVFIHRYNIRLLEGFARISARPVLKLAAAATLAALLLRFGFPRFVDAPYLTQGVSGLGLMVVLGIVSYYLFDLASLRREWRMYSI